VRLADSFIALIFKTATRSFKSGAIVAGIHRGPCGAWQQYRAKAASGLFLQGILLAPGKSASAS
jgi:hypothetical protein